MSDATLPPTEILQLPNDQDATGRTFGDEELALLKQVLENGCLISTKGKVVQALEKEFAARIGSKFAYACSSGTSAIHAAIAAINPEPGDEIITSPITDMGALAPIVYQGAIPVFTDVDPRTCNMTAETIAARISDRTRAIVVTHLFGNPCVMGPIMELARTRNIPVIEDCAQAYLATVDGRQVGTLGAIGCFSMQQGKHMTCGEGGLVVTDDPDLARRIFLFINKAWGYGDKNPDHYFAAPNYRLTELCGAVALAQFHKLDRCVHTRVSLAARLTGMLKGLPGIETPRIEPNAVHTYWKYAPRVDATVIEGGSPGMGALLKERGIASAPRYIVKPAYMCQVFRDQVTFGNSHYPFNLARPEAVNYDKSLFPGVFAGLEQVLVLPWNERYTEEHVDYIARSVIECATRLSKGVA